MKFNFNKFLVLLLTGFLLFSLPQIINRFTVHESVTYQLEKPHKQIDNWQQSGFAIHTSPRTNSIWLS